MLLLVQHSGLGSALHTVRRGIPYIGRAGNARHRHVRPSAAAELDQLTAKDLLHELVEYHLYHPEGHETIKEFIRYRLEECPICVNHKEDPAKHKTVPRRALYAASTSLAAVEEFLKQQLGIAAHQKVKVTYSLAETPEQAVAFKLQESELNEQAPGQRPMAYFVGYANGWFVSEL